VNYRVGWTRPSLDGPIGENKPEGDWPAWMQCVWGVTEFLSKIFEAVSAGRNLIEKISNYLYRAMDRHCPLSLENIR
jgi:hypothetical protein